MYTAQSQIRVPIKSGDSRIRISGCLQSIRGDEDTTEEEDVEDVDKRDGVLYEILIGGEAGRTYIFSE